MICDDVEMWWMVSYNEGAGFFSQVNYNFEGILSGTEF
jgi:hypothetical protein